MFINDDCECGTFEHTKQANFVKSRLFYFIFFLQFVQYVNTNVKYKRTDALYLWHQLQLISLKMYYAYKMTRYSDAMQPTQKRI